MIDRLIDVYGIVMDVLLRGFNPSKKSMTLLLDHLSQMSGIDAITSLPNGFYDC